MATLSTGDVCKRLGFTINAALIEKLGVEPVEIVKSHPRWSEDNFKSIGAALVDHIHEVVMAKHAPVVKTPKPAKAAPKPTTPVDDDDEL